MSLNLKKRGKVGKWSLACMGHGLHKWNQTEKELKREIQFHSEQIPSWKILFGFFLFHFQTGFIFFFERLTFSHFSYMWLSSPFDET
jgi:hypothetical protein